MNKNQWDLVSKEIKKAMIDKGMRNVDLAKAISLSEHHVSSVITGYIASKQSRERICSYFGIKF